MIVTIAVLEARHAAMLAALDPWRVKGRSIIGRRVPDAANHARTALTKALKAAPDGRATVARARRSPSFAAALARLDEARDGLVSLVADCRGWAYAGSFGWWADHTPPGMRRAGPLEPTKAGISRARGMVLHGVPLITEVATATDEDGRQLLATLSQAAARALAHAAAVDLIDGWERRSIDGLEALLDTLLSDSQVAADAMAQRDCVRPELIGE